LVEPGWEWCQITPQYVSGSINLQYRFRAVARRGHSTYTAASSPPFLTTPPPIQPTEGARAALTAVVDLLLQEGWQAESQSEPDPWYARSFRRSLAVAGPQRRRRARQDNGADA
jgi:hypothetical protein